MLWAIIGGVLAVFLLAAVFVIRRSKSVASDQLTSLVMLRSDPATITEEQVAAAGRKVFAEAAGVIALPRDGMPAGLAAGYAITLNGGPVFYVINSHRPYDENSGEAASGHPDPAVRAALAGHKAWVSVDVVGGAPDPAVRRTVMVSLATIAVQLMDGKTTLLYSTWLDRMALPKAIGKAAQSGDLDAVFAA